MLINEKMKAQSGQTKYNQMVVFIWLQNQIIQPLESPGTSPSQYGDVTVISECYPCGTATKWKQHQEEANV